MKRPLSYGEYRNIRGQICPACRGQNDLNGGFFIIYLDEVRRTVKCGDCGHSWIDVYKLTHYFDLRMDEDWSHV